MNFFFVDISFFLAFAQVVFILNPPRGTLILNPDIFTLFLLWRLNQVKH